MRNLLNPRWLFIVNTLPIAVLFILQWGDFQVIKSLLSEESLRLWKQFGGILAGLAIVNVLYAGFLMVMKKRTSPWYGALCFLAYLFFLVEYYSEITTIFPFDIPQWMLSGNIEIYACTFLMPMMAYCLFVLVIWITQTPQEHKAWLNFLITILIPIAVYILGVLIIPLFGMRVNNIDNIILVLFCVATLLFLFFLVRTLYILLSKKSSIWKKYELYWKIPITILFPLVGLILNNGGLTQSFFGSAGGIFGDFSSLWFPALALITGGLLCLPNPKNKQYHLLLFLARCVTFAYSVYFFLVFLPYLPLSILAVLLIGLGFLMLSPLMLFLIYVNDLYKDFISLAGTYSRKMLILSACIAFLVIPAILTVTFMNDRKVLNEAMEYVYKPDYSKTYSLNKSSIARTLQNIKGQKERGSFLFFSYTPYISTYYNWLVLDKLTLSNKKIEMLQNIFEGEYITYNIVEEELHSDDRVKITDWEVESQYDEVQQVWKSWVHLEITNFDDSRWGEAEFATPIDLPDGCWISDYYLYVDDRKEMGMLSEKKSALWVYSQIKNTRRDPGILYYVRGNRVAFKVFPFAGNETRKTGIEFTHKEPVTLTLEYQNIQLGDLTQTHSQPSVIEEPSVLYVSAKEKENLRKVYRKSYFHFLVDVSMREKESKKDWGHYIEKLRNRNPHLAEDAKVSLIDTYTRTFSVEDDWQSAYNNSPFEGGFYADLGIKKALYQAWQENAYPVIVLLSNNDASPNIGMSYADFRFVYPESDYFFEVLKDGQMDIHSLVYNSGVVVSPPIKPFAPVEVLEYNHPDGTVSYLRNDGKPEIILLKEKEMVAESAIRPKDWNTGLALRGKWLKQQMYPNYSDKDWRNLVLQSFESQILTPVTSYMVVENEAQKAALLRKQKQVLSADRAFDIGDSESNERMSEPGMMVLLLFLGLILLCYNRKRIFVKK